jgi:uncharacterized membrane protein YfcA
MEISDSIFILAVLFFLVAFIYSSVGLGGGSSYTALMAIAGLNALTIPMISLMLNLVVSSLGSYNFMRRDHARFRIVAPFLLTSMPMAWVGGAMQISPTLFYWVLFVSLLFVVVRMVFLSEVRIRLDIGLPGRIFLSLLAGALLGLIAGIAGIGGGIFLVPLIIVLGLGSEKEAAACGAIFVWLNSCAGLISRLQYNAIDIVQYLPLVMAVFVGGALGSWLGAGRFSPLMLRRILGLVMTLALFALGRKLLA